MRSMSPSIPSAQWRYPGSPLLVTLKRDGTLLWIGLHPLSNGITETERTEADVTIEKFQVRSNGAHLAAISELIDAGQLRVNVDTVVPLAETRKAHERGKAGHLQGIIVLRVAEEGRSLE